jgi:hypothetical protein
MDFGESKPLEFQYLQSDVWAAIMSELGGSFDLYLLWSVASLHLIVDSRSSLLSFQVNCHYHEGYSCRWSVAASAPYASVSISGE